MQSEDSHTEDLTPNKYYPERTTGGVAVKYIGVQLLR